ncbi:MAG: hypothetical protein Q9195_006698 [Heterodermia aff. obscurata]
MASSSGSDEDELEALVPEHPLKYLLGRDNEDDESDSGLSDDEGHKASTPQMYGAKDLRRCEGPLRLECGHIFGRECIDDRHKFWCGNSVIRLQIREWTSIVLAEELILRTGDRLAIFNFRGLRSKLQCNKMRDAIIAIRTYHCFYKPHPTDSNIQEDIIPEHLRLEPGGSKPWLESFMGKLSKVDEQELAEDDRDCSLCKGIYEEDISGNGTTTEVAVRLPSSHVFGYECLRLLLLSKDEGGW